MNARFVDLTAKPIDPPEVWPTIVITKVEIDREIERLASLPPPADGRRLSSIVHPMSRDTGLGLSPGIEVTLNVLKPGERTAARRTNANAVDMCITGTGVADIGGTRIGFERFDVWNTPSMRSYFYENTGRDLMVRLSYSNAPLLQKLRVHYVEEGLPEMEVAGVKPSEGKSRAKDLAPIMSIGADGAHLMTYEHLIDPDVVPSNALHWPWKVVEEKLRLVKAIGAGYTGRRLFILYNPATERRNGTTHSFFASIASYPGNIVDTAHRHSSAAVNYWFAGSGRSVVDGKTVEWSAGDLMLSAPGWSVHHHSSFADGFYSFTVQDHPLQIAMESLIWQENLQSKIRNLGAEAGFQTNLAELTAAPAMAK